MNAWRTLNTKKIIVNGRVNLKAAVNEVLIIERFCDSRLQESKLPKELGISALGSVVGINIGRLYFFAT